MWGSYLALNFEQIMHYNITDLTKKEKKGSVPIQTHFLKRCHVIYLLWM